MEHAGDPAFQRLDWSVQRLGRCLLALFVAAAAAGVIGPGPCNRAHLDSADDQFSIGFERVLHRDTPSTLRIAAQDPTRLVAVAADESPLVELAKIRPAPTRERVVSGELLLEYDTAQSGPLELELVPRALGVARMRVRLGDGPALSLSQLVLP